MLKKEQTTAIDFFDYSYRQLEEDYMRYSALGLPLFCVIDNIIKMMQNGEVTYFIMPRARSIDGKNHYFYFKVEGNNYKYRGCDL